MACAWMDVTRIQSWDNSLCHFSLSFSKSIGLQIPFVPGVRLVVDTGLDGSDGLQSDINNEQRVTLKKLELSMPKQGVQDLLEYYVGFLDSMEEVSLSKIEQLAMFKAGLNQETRSTYLALKMCKVSMPNIKSLVKAISEDMGIKAINLLMMRDRLRQGDSEKASSFLRRWMHFVSKAEVMGLDTAGCVSMSVSRLRQADVIADMIDDWTIIPSHI
jgi:hypothetical protein